MGPGYVLVLVGCIGNFLQKNPHQISSLNSEVEMVIFSLPTPKKNV